MCLQLNRGPGCARPSTEAVAAEKFSVARACQQPSLCQHRRTKKPSLRHPTNSETPWHSVLVIPERRWGQMSGTITFFFLKKKKNRQKGAAQRNWSRQDTDQYRGARQSSDTSALEGDGLVMPQCWNSHGSERSKICGRLGGRGRRYTLVERKAELCHVLVKGVLVAPCSPFVLICTR